MLARCVQCGVRFVVPDDRARNPELQVRCRCGAAFALHAPSPTLAAAHPTPPQGGSPAQALPPSRPGAWRRCVNHAQAKSESVCPACNAGFCRECERRVNNVPVCPRCESLCSDAAKVEEDEARSRQRARTMKDDIGFIAAYPITDRAAFAMLAVFTWIFSFFQGFAMGVILSKGVLVWYSFTALTRVANGRFRGYMPNFGDITDIVHPLRLSFAAFLAASWPLLALPFAFGPPELPAFLQSSSAGDALVHAQDVPSEPAEAEEGNADEETEGPPAAEGAGAAAGVPRGFEDFERGPRQPVWVLGLYALALVWQLLYLPMAMIVAAISRGFFKTLNPLIGIDAISKMGSAYWFAALLFTVLVTAQAILTRLLDIIPIAGSLLASFIAAYVSLSTGCALGLAVFKKARELNLD